MSSSSFPPAMPGALTVAIELTPAIGLSRVSDVPVATFASSPAVTAVIGTVAIPWPPPSSTRTWPVVTR
jgi:hypothetical protein